MRIRLTAATSPVLTSNVTTYIVLFPQLAWSYEREDQDILYWSLSTCTVSYEKLGGDLGTEDCTVMQF